ncbi:MAG: hypothetical protein AAGH88_05570 [Planctomycetota bacterium]
MRQLQASDSDPGSTAYEPHPLDVLIFAVLDEEGAKQQADLLAALSADHYESRGKRRTVSAGTLQRRLPELVKCGALSRTANGYLLADRSAIEAADDAFPG